MEENLIVKDSDKEELDITDKNDPIEKETNEPKDISTSKETDIITDKDKDIEKTENEPITVKIEEKKELPKKSRRNYGIDILRIVSMIFICMLHILGQGGILLKTEPQSVNYFSSWFLEIFAYCSVDCYALISGYVGVFGRYRLANITYLFMSLSY